MSFLDDLSEGVLDFFLLIWMDLVILLVAVLLYVWGTFNLPKHSFSKLPRKNGHGAVAGMHKIIEVAMLGCGIVQRPFRRQQKEPPAANGLLSRSVPSLDKNGFPLIHSQENFVYAIMDVHDSEGVDATFGLLREMHRLGLEITTNAVNRMFRGHSPNENHALLCRMKKAGVTPNIVMHNCVVGNCVYAGDINRARAVVEEMRKVGVEPDMITYCTLLKGCNATRDLLGAKEVLQEMLDSRHKPLHISFNTLINAAVINGDFQVAWDTIDMMKIYEVPIDAYTVSIMMKALRQRNSRRPLHSKHAARVFEFLDDSSVDFCSDEVLLTTVVDTCVWHKEHSRLERILESYLISKLRPTVPVYGSLIKAAKSLKRMDLVWKLWWEMVRTRELQPSQIVLGCMVDALVCNSLVDEAVTIFREWKVKVVASTVMYSTLAKGFLLSRQPTRAMEILREMKAEGVPRSTLLYNMVIGVHASQGTMDEVAELMQNMVSDCCTPDIITFSTVVKGHCVKGDLESALSVLRQAKDSGVELDSIVYSSIFYGCHRHNRPDLVDELIADMHSLGLKPSDYTLSLIVKMYGAQGRLNRAFEVVDSMSRQPPCIDLRVAISLFGECLRIGTLDRVEDIFQSLMTHGGPDAKSFLPLIVCLVRRGEFQRARGFAEAWYLPRARTTWSAQAVLMNQLLCALTDSKEGESLALLEKMRAMEANTVNRQAAHTSSRQAER